MAFMAVFSSVLLYIQGCFQFFCNTVKLYGTCIVIPIINYVVTVSQPFQSI